MSQRTVSRRLLVGGTSAALLLGVVGFVPLLGSASAAGCPSWTDPKGDAAWHDPLAGQADPSGNSYDAQMDIVASSLSVVGDSLVATITTEGLSEDFSDAGDEFGVDFTVNGVEVNLYSDRDPSGTVAGIVPAGPATSTYDVAKKTVTIKAKLSDLDKSVGSATAGKTISALSSYSSNQLFGERPVVQYDESATPATLAVAADCGGAAGPAPSGSGTPTATPTGSAGPTPTPSGTATPTPSGTASPTPSGTATPSASPSPSPSSSIGPDGLYTQPRKGCAEFTDAVDDADPTGIGFFTEPALDVTQVTYKSPVGTLQLHVKLNDASAALFPFFDGPVYAASFVVNGKTVSLSATGDGPAAATVGGKESKDIKATAKLDTAASSLVLSVPVDGLSAAVGPVKVGAAITGTTVTTAAASAFGDQPADSATGTKPQEKTYTYGDNTCFRPAPGKLTVDADPRGRYTDTTLLFATLKDADDAPVVGARVIAALTGGRVVAARTDKEGVADLALPIGVPAGTKVLTVAFAGTNEVGATKATRRFTVLAEPTALRGAGISGGVQATLVDDDRAARPVAGQVVTFTVAGKRYDVRTNSRGVATLTRLAEGTVVEVSYAGSRGYFLAAKAITARAR